MTVLNIKPTVWAHSLITLGTEMLHSVFSFYYVKLFLEVYQISEVAFYQGQIILMIWNILNDLIGYFLNSQANCCLSQGCSVFYGGPLYAAAFLLPWFPWMYYHEGDWLSGFHLVVSLCAFHSSLTCVQRSQCLLLAETFPRHESRLQLLRMNRVASLLGTTSILFCGLISYNMEILPNFQAVAVVLAFLAVTILYGATYHMRHYESKRSLEENLLSESEQDLAWTTSILQMRQILSQKNLYLFLIMNFFQVFHLTFFTNFMMIFADNLIPRGVLSSSMRSVMYGAGFICPQCLLLTGQSWLKRYGYYKIILASFYLQGAASIVMIFLGQEYYYCLALYLTVIMVIVQASFCLFNLPLADMVDADLSKFNPQSPLSSMISGINALFTKPAQSLAPMVVLSKLNQYGYGEPSRRMLLDLQDVTFSLVCIVPLGIAVIQILAWSSFSVRSRVDSAGSA